MLLISTKVIIKNSCKKTKPYSFNNKFDRKIRTSNDGDVWKKGQNFSERPCSFSFQIRSVIDHEECHRSYRS